MELALFTLVLQKPKGANDASITMFESVKGAVGFSSEGRGLYQISYKV